MGITIIKPCIVGSSVQQFVAKNVAKDHYPASWAGGMGGGGWWLSFHPGPPYPCPKPLRILRPQAPIQAQAEDRVLQQRTTLRNEEPVYFVGILTRLAWRTRFGSCVPHDHPAARFLLVS